MTFHVTPMVKFYVPPTRLLSEAMPSDSKTRRMSQFSDAFLGSFFMTSLRPLIGRGMAPWQRTFEGYIGSTKSRIEIHDMYASTAEGIKDHLERLKETLSDQPCHTWPSLVAKGFSFSLSKERDTFTQCQHIVIVDSTGQPVGAQMGGSVYISDQNRRRGLGAEIMLSDAVVFGRGRLHSSLYSPYGYAAARASFILGRQLCDALAADRRPGVAWLPKPPAQSASL